MAAVPDYLFRPQYQTLEQKRITQMESQLSDLTQMLKELQVQNSSIQRTLNDNLAVLHDLGVWHPQIDAKVDELHHSVVNLQQKVDQLTAQPPPTAAASRIYNMETIDLMKSAVHRQHTASSGATQQPIGTDVETSNRGIGNGVVTTFVPTLVEGAHNFPHPYVGSLESQLHFDMTKAIPQFEFPKFDGKNPKL